MIPDNYTAESLSRIIHENTLSLAKSRSSLDKKAANIGSTALKPLPEWAKKQICKTRELDYVIKAIKMRAPDAKLEKANALLSQCHTIQKEIEARFGRLAVVRELDKIIPFADNNKLLIHLNSDPSSRHPIPPSQMEWHMHLGLLMQIYFDTADLKLRQIISFLAANYLAKVVPYANDSYAEWQTAEMFQKGLFNQVPHHREFPSFEPFLLPEINKYLNVCNSTRNILIDNKHIEEILPLRFEVVSLAEDIGEDRLAMKIREYLSNGFDWRKYFNKPFLFDLTPYLEKYILSVNESDASLKAVFEENRQPLESQIDEMVCSTAKNMRREFPEIITNEADEKRLQALIRSNITCVCRTEVRGTGVLSVLPFFEDPKYFNCSSTEPLLNVPASENQAKFTRTLCCDRRTFFQVQFEEFVNVTGIRLGAVHGRHSIFEFMSLEDFLTKYYKSIFQMVEFSEASPTSPIFTKKEDFIHSRSFESCKRKFLTPSQDKAYLHILGTPLLNMIEGLLSKLDDRHWEELNAREDLRQLLQTSLYRITVHLANADFHSGNYGRFTQEIEVIQNELIDLLFILSPYDQKDFQKIYLNSLTDHIPTNVLCQIIPGLTKCGMNSFAAILAAVYKSTPNPELTYGSGVYTESWGHIGKNRSLSSVIQNPTIDTVDFYLGEFNHNISIHLDVDKYEASDVIQEVKTLLEAKPNIKHLTVAIDGTIDFHISEQSKHLLESFAEEIKIGKLNFVFFRSGQKYDMLGMDNLYGSPFWVLNNGGEQWSHFHTLGENPAFTADPLSLQWFCLLYEFAPQATDIYRRQIFSNVREILKHVPRSLTPGQNANIKICQVDEGMQPSFIEIKVLADRGAKVADEIKELFLSKFVEKGLKAHARASFGFFHPNINIIGSSLNGEPRNVRLNPGLDPQEIPVFIEFLNELAQKFA